MVNNHAKVGIVSVGRKKCQEDVYFRELIRYIHLSPLRANLVNSFAELDQYKWSGHSVLVGNRKNNWQDCNYVLEWSGRRKREAINAYREYAKKGSIKVSDQNLWEEV